MKLKDFKKVFMDVYLSLQEKQGHYVYIEDIEEKMNTENFWEKLWRFSRFDEEGKEIVFVPSRKLEERKTYTAGGRRYAMVSASRRLREKYGK